MERHQKNQRHEKFEFQRENAKLYGAQMEQHRKRRERDWKWI